MAKIYGLFGSMTGKLADTVMSVRNGEQIARKYQPVVFNPSTPAQIAQRAKLKLMSQLSAIMAPAMGFRKKGSVSARNLFTKANIGAAIFSEKNADINLAAVKLTNGILSLPDITVTYANSTLSAELSSALGKFDRVLYFVFQKIGDELRFADSSNIERTDDNPTAPATFGLGDGEYYVYAYAIRYNSDAARTMFGNITTPSALDVARIITSSSLLESDVTLSETKVGVHTPSV